MMRNQIMKCCFAIQKLILTNSYVGPFILRNFAAQFIPDEIATQIDAHKYPELFWSLVSVSLEELETNESYFQASSSLLKGLDEATIDTELIPLRQIPFKTLVVFGSDDTTIDTKKSEQWWTQQLLNAKVEYIKESGHLCFLENEDDTFNKVINFLNN
ncbi:alpha/beta hydrolase domain-containing protein [Trichomonas vaginalis G3]|uniref:alpha/beta hydrolase domain-containing protein n=1 Tax=Trichomonas vaginalis (strain ATCC PRA-98 / G3) TaxID=412133 RepID=UPI0021E56B16|nr:alpha/beta hydrolase domain-containing protein [Trichomonas vaginalis G3]KAI5483187.1 alpha/beta hydrolase domain-containing protein [Trichomonas vaginalis G3]